MPISSSAHNIPWLSISLIFAFFIFNESPFVLVKVLPTGATTTVWSTSTLGAPQIILRSSESPISTVVNFSLSALGCLIHSLTFPIKSWERSVFVFEKS